MTLIEAINSGKPFRCKDIRVPKGYINPWLIYRDTNGAWFHYADCETAMKQEELRQMLHNYFHSENWQIKKEKGGYFTVKNTEGKIVGRLKIT